MATKGKPPHAAPSGTRWVWGSKDGWMLHEKRIQAKNPKKNMKIKKGKTA